MEKKAEVLDLSKNLKAEERHNKDKYEIEKEKSRSEGKARPDFIK